MQMETELNGAAGDKTGELCTTSEKYFVAFKSLNHKFTFELLSYSRLNTQDFRSRLRYGIRRLLSGGDLLDVQANNPP